MSTDTHGHGLLREHALSCVLFLPVKEISRYCASFVSEADFTGGEHSAASGTGPLLCFQFVYWIHEMEQFSGASSSFVNCCSRSFHYYIQHLLLLTLTHQSVRLVYRWVISTKAMAHQRYSKVWMLCVVPWDQAHSTTPHCLDRHRH